MRFFFLSGLFSSPNTTSLTSLPPSLVLFPPSIIFTHTFHITSPPTLLTRFESRSHLTSLGSFAPSSIHLCHADEKDKEFELEITWICPESKGRHVFIPQDLLEEAERKAKESMDEGMED